MDQSVGPFLDSVRRLPPATGAHPSPRAARPDLRHKEAVASQMSSVTVELLLVDIVSALNLPAGESCSPSHNVGLGASFSSTLAWVHADAPENSLWALDGHGRDSLTRRRTARGQRRAGDRSQSLLVAGRKAQAGPGGDEADGGVECAQNRLGDHRGHAFEEVVGRGGADVGAVEPRVPRSITRDTAPWRGARSGRGCGWSPATGRRA